ncbi:MAG: aldo/keto reductase [Alphaproteobacteria bacterium]|nr:aldo/keto reductase [Alphaproteobacteria bacterium]
MPTASLAAAAIPLITRAIPASGEAIPIIGMGTWITMNVGNDPALRADRLKVVQAFFDEGGGMIDSSPMYGSSEAVIGDSLSKIANSRGLFSATKVWTLSQWMGVRQMNNSFDLWGLKRFDLMQIHNLVDWEAHLETLLEWKKEGLVRYIGITTSHGRRHDDLADIMRKQPIDFVQLTYNMLDLEAEDRLLPLAKERGIAVIVNRPFQRGGLFDRFDSAPLPDWAGAIDCSNWAQLFLKFVVSHPAVTCAIPATSRVDHLRQNMAAGRGRLPDAEMRAQMIRYIETL